MRRLNKNMAHGKNAGLTCVKPRPPYSLLFTEVGVYSRLAELGDTLFILREETSKVFKWEREIESKCWGGIESFLQGRLAEKKKEKEREKESEKKR